MAARKGSGSTAGSGRWLAPNEGGRASRVGSFGGEGVLVGVGWQFGGVDSGVDGGEGGVDGEAEGEGEGEGEGRREV